MRLPLSWLLEYAAIDLTPDDDEGVQEMSRRLTACGLEVESLEPVGQDITGVVVAEVLDIEVLTGFNKPIRYCQVSTGDGQERHVICGASNFAVGDRVALAVPGAVLPGGFEIGARKTYGRISEGMICSAAELAIGDDHSGIMVLPPDAPLGTDFVSYAGLRDVVFDINVTPDKGFALSVRGVARELAISYQVPYTDPADVGMLVDVSVVSPDVYPVSIEDTTACDRFVVREVRGIDPATPTPLAMKIRLSQRRPAIGVAAGRRHQLPDAGARPAPARVRPVPAHRPHRGPASRAGRAAGDHRPRPAHARPRGHPHHGFLRPDLARRDDGRGRHRGVAGLARPGHRGGAFLPARHRPHEPAAQARFGSVRSVRARRRPRASGACLGPRRHDAGGR